MSKLGEDLIIFTVDTAALYLSAKAMEYRRTTFENYLTNMGVPFDKGEAGGTLHKGRTMTIYFAKWDDRDVVQELLGDYGEYQFYNTEPVKGCKTRSFNCYNVTTGKMLREGLLTPVTAKKAQYYESYIKHPITDSHWLVIDDIKDKSKGKEVA